MHPQTLSEEQHVVATREGGFGTVGASPQAMCSGAASPVQSASSWDCGAGGLVMAPASQGTPCLPPSTAAVSWGPSQDRLCRAGEGPLRPRPLGRAGPVLGCCPQPRMRLRAAPGVPACLGSAWNSSAVLHGHPSISDSASFWSDRAGGLCSLARGVPRLWPSA